MTRAATAHSAARRVLVPAAGRRSTTTGVRHFRLARVPMTTVRDPDRPHAHLQRMHD